MNSINVKAILPLSEQVEKTQGLNKDPDEKKRKLANDISQLSNSITNLGSQAQNLLQTAQQLNLTAEYADKIADAMDQGKLKKFEDHNKEEVKRALMELIGIPAEFVDQLGILAKGGAGALREGAALYRAKALDIRREADFKLIDKENKEREFKAKITIQSKINDSIKTEHCLSTADLIAKVNDESFRDDAEETYRQMLLQQEADMGMIGSSGL